MKSQLSISSGLPCSAFVFALVCLAPSPRAVAQDIDQLMNQSRAQLKAGKFPEAERLARQALELAERRFQAQPLVIARASNQVGFVKHAQRQYAEAVPYLKRALALFEKACGREHADVATGMNNLAAVYKQLDRFADAKPLLKESLAIRRRLLPADHHDLAGSLNNLAGLYTSINRYDEAQTLLNEAVQIWERTNAEELPIGLSSLAELKHAQGQFREAERLYLRALAIQENRSSADHPELSSSLQGLGAVYIAQGRYDDAIGVLERTRRITEKSFGRDNAAVATALKGLAEAHQYRGDVTDAEYLYQQARSILESKAKVNPASLGLLLNSHGLLYNATGRYREAETLLKKSLSLYEQVYGKEHRNVASGLNNLAAVHRDQAHFADAETLYLKSLAIMRRVLPTNHPNIFATLNSLGIVYQRQGRLAEAADVFGRALEGREKALGPNHHLVGIQLDNLGLLYGDQGKFNEAVQYTKRALESLEEAVGKEHLDTGIARNNLAYLYCHQGQYGKAAPLVEEAIDVLDSIGAPEQNRLWPYFLRAEVRWHADRREEAIGDLGRALDLAEQARALGSGAEREHAAFFTHLGTVFDRMVAWQVELGNFPEAFAAAERGRARSLIDQLELQGVDLLAGVPIDRARTLRQRETDARATIVALQRQLDAFEVKGEGASGEERQRTLELGAQLATARQDVLEAYREVRNASPAYRLATSTHFQPAVAAELMAWVAQHQAYLFEYVLGSEGSWLLVVPPEGEPRAVPLALTPEQAGRLATDAGWLTSDRLQKVLTHPETGILPRLARRGTLRTASPRGLDFQDGASAEALPKLAALWEVLLPEPERQALCGGKVKLAVIVPDGPLALLPFETLVVEPGNDPQYLLDVGPPFVYTASATLFRNLAERATFNGSALASILTVGDPDHSTPPKGQPSSAPVGSRARGDHWPRLGSAAQESKWVAELFRNRQLSVRQLGDREATEARVCEAMHSASIIHLACHGFADESDGNFFGGLVLAQGGTSADDGILTLGEIQSLDLRACELAILSACDTNYGPRQRGEGVWALSRGFLVAGARRVVSSTWQVDDKAGASLISYFCGSLAKGEGSGNVIEYAKALQAAKRWVRQQHDWESPYYWGTFTHIGPP